MGRADMREGTFGKADQILVCGFERRIREIFERAHLFQITVVCRESPGVPRCSVLATQRSSEQSLRTQKAKPPAELPTGRAQRSRRQ